MNKNKLNIMETTVDNKVKVNLKKLKATIKVKAEYQVFLKNQRKTERLVGKREMDPYEAAEKHRINRLELRASYAALATLRGRDVSAIDQGSFNDEYEERRYNRMLKDILEKYYVSNS